jgi:hypothetical protein
MPQPWDWTNSRAHIELLTRFDAQPLPLEDVISDEAELRESLRSALGRLVHDGAIDWTTRGPDLAGCTVVQLRDTLRAAGAKVGGTKDVLIDRLRAVAPERAAELCPAAAGYVLTTAGSEIVARYRHAIDAEQDPQFATASAALASGDYERAWNIAHPGESENLRATYFASLMGWLGAARPRLLGFLTDDEVRWVKWAVGQRFLWGKERVEIPAAVAINCGHLEDLEAVERMMRAAVHYQRDTAPSRVVSLFHPPRDIWELHAAPDDHGCAVCRGRKRMRGTLAQIGELPHPGCTSPVGCRCRVERPPDTW